MPPRLGGFLNHACVMCYARVLLIETRLMRFDKSDLGERSSRRAPREVRCEKGPNQTLAHKKSRIIEREVLRLVLALSDHAGYSTSLPGLSTAVRYKVPDVSDRELVDTLKRLQPQHLQLRKWIKARRRFFEYPAGTENDAEFFYTGDFQLRHTPYTTPYLEDLDDEIAEPVGMEPTAEAEKGVGRRASPSKPTQRQANRLLPLIAETRLKELRRCKRKEYDLRKLVRLCEELNIAYGAECYLATAMLTRSLLDHVPPLFGKHSFAEVANNHGPKSFKDTMAHLEGAARKVADGYLHGQIRNKESLPTAQQVSFAPPLDVLLAEILRMGQ
jgi:hypothetical protein